MLLEEPWSGMEAETKNRVITLLGEYKSSTRVIISNDETFAQKCDQVFVMTEEGTLINSSKN
jgi:ABC-type bacteriocin/lantibiotic exporter with double-glycine peptidase domain